MQLCRVKEKCLKTDLKCVNGIYDTQNDNYRTYTNGMTRSEWYMWTINFKFFNTTYIIRCSYQECVLVHKLSVIKSQLYSSSCDSTTHTSIIRNARITRRQAHSYQVLTAFQFDDLFAFQFHACDNTVQRFCQIILKLLIGCVSDLLSQVFTFTGHITFNKKLLKTFLNTRNQWHNQLFTTIQTRWLFKFSITYAAI